MRNLAKILAWMDRSIKGVQSLDITGAIFNIPQAI